MEHVLVAVAEVFEVADIFVLREQLLEIRFRLLVLELVVLQLANRLGKPPRHLRKLALLLLDSRLLPLERIQRVALAVEDVLEFLLHLGERVLEVEFAVALAHLLAKLLDELLEAHHLHAVEVHPLAHHPVHRLADVVGVGHVLGQLLEHLVGVKLQLLSAVPLRVARGDHRKRSGVIREPAALAILVEFLMKVQALEDEFARRRHQSRRFKRPEQRDGFAQAGNLAQRLHVFG